MAISKRSLREEVRKSFMEKINKFLVSENQEVLVVGTNEFSIPVVLSDGEEDFLVLTFKMPIGSRDGDGYDGYDMAKDFALKQKMKAEKAKSDKIAKAKKIERDKKNRALKAEREKKEKEK